MLKINLSLRGENGINSQVSRLLSQINSRLVGQIEVLGELANLVYPYQFVRVELSM